MLICVLALRIIEALYQTLDSIINADPCTISKKSENNVV